MACHVRKNEIVEVISGDHRGARGKVLRVDRDRGLVVVEGVNVVFRHVRPSRRNPQGGRLEKEAPIHISNVLPLDAKTQRGTRVHFDVARDTDGRAKAKQRVATSGSILGSVSKAQRGS
jgi:large subunit ribosomal protein L24